MILVDGEKYACVQCIRGHRSSTCKHSHRPLVQVRSRGRPSLNQTQRIAVTASELVLSRDQVTFQEDYKANQNSNVQEESLKQKKSCCSKEKKETPHFKLEPGSSPIKTTGISNSVKSCCKSIQPESVIRGCCNHTSLKTQSNCPACKSGTSSVILLKASKRHFVEVKNGNLDFIEPVVHSDITPSGTSLFNNDSEIKKRAVDEQNISQLHVFKKVKVNRVAHIPQLSSQETSKPNLQILSNTTPFTHQLSHFDNRRDSSPFEQVYDMALATGCADECECGPDCSCPACLIHRTNEELKAYGILDNSTDSSVTPTNTMFESDEMLRSDRMNGSQNINHPEAFYAQQTYDTNPISIPSTQVFDSNFFSLENLINFKTIDELFNNNFQPHLEPEGCYCDDDKCSCFNCGRHYIKNGVKIIPDSRSIMLSSTTDNSSQTINLNPIGDYRTHDCACDDSECLCYNCSKHSRLQGVNILPASK